jgi:hypothetical protein
MTFKFIVLTPKLWIRLRILEFRDVQGVSDQSSLPAIDRQ